MLSGVAHDADQTNHAQSDHLSGWGFLNIPSDVAREDD